MYNNAKIGETTTIPIEDVLSMERNGGGYRTEQQVSDLKNDIVKNGITTPIEIYKKMMEHSPLKMETIDLK